MNNPFGNILLPCGPKSTEEKTDISFFFKLKIVKRTAQAKHDTLKVTEHLKENEVGSLL